MWVGAGEHLTAYDDWNAARCYCRHRSLRSEMLVEILGIRMQNLVRRMHQGEKVLLTAGATLLGIPKVSNVVGYQT